MITWKFLEAASDCNANIGSKSFLFLAYYKKPKCPYNLG